MKKNWKIKETSQSEKHSEGMFSDLEPVIEKILINRGICDEDSKKSFLNCDYEQDLHDPFLLNDMEKAVERILMAKKNQEKICIYGDYDADGVTSATLLKDFFDQIEIESFCYIPDRNSEGYGINEDAVEYIKKQKANLIVSVDCGISNFDEVEMVNKEKIDIVILDHHHVPENIPNAVAVVDPKKNGDKYPFKDLAGVGVVFKFIQAVASKIEDFDEQKLKWFLDLVAVGTIADCVPLIGENRVLVKYGLIVLAKTKRVGFKQIFNVGRIAIDENTFPTSQQVAFQIAPRINAAGRMDHANIAYELLNCKEGEDPEARVLALEIEDQNQRRQKFTKQIVDEVEKEIGEIKESDKIIVASSPHWSIGVLGLASGKITDKYHRPSILLKEKEDGLLTGSCRSIPKFNIVETLEKHKNLFEKYGGHSQAAGLSIRKEKFEEFKKTMTQEAEKVLSEETIKIIEIDVEINPMEINEKIARELFLLEPFGIGNQQPIFYAKNMEVVDKKLIGKTGAHMKLWFKRKNGLIEAIAFSLGERYSEIKIGQKIEAIFNIEEDSWNGNKKLQLKLIDFSV